MRHPLRRPRRRALAALCTSVLSIGLLTSGPGAPAAQAADDPNAVALDKDAILAANQLDERQWYKDNIPFVDTPDNDIDDVYYYRWSSYKRALRYTVPGTGYVSTEYDVPIGYAGGPYTALSDAANYHLLDGRWLHNRDYAGDYLDFWLRGAGTPGVRGFSESITSAAYQRYLATGDVTQIKAALPYLIALYKRWDSNFDADVTVNGTQSTSDLYQQSPVSDATEYTETSMHSSNWFSGGRGYRPTINAYMFGAAQAISKIATMTGDTATANDYTAKAAQLKSAVQNSLWDPQRKFFMQVYNTDATNGALKQTRTTWRELMGYAPWAFNLPDAQYSSAWKYLNDPTRFKAPFGPTTLERVHDFEAEQATRNHANLFSSSTSSNGQYIGQIDFADSYVTFTVDAPAAGTYPVTVYYANGTTGTSTHQLITNDDTANPITVSYAPTGAWQKFSDSQAVTVQVPMKAGANTLKFAKGTSFAELDRITANPYFDYQAIPAVQKRDDANCCHWNGPSWPYQTSQVLTGMANLLQDYPAQSYVTKADYATMLAQFADLQHKDGKPYVAEAANGDTGDWIYDGQNFSENYNHSSFNDLVLTGLLGIKPQADNTMVLKPLIPAGWDYYAVESLPYHGHTYSIRWDKDGTHYGKGSGLQVFQDGVRILQTATLAASTTVNVAAPVTPAQPPRMMNVAANPMTADQDWFAKAITQPYPKAFASYTNTVSNGPHCHSGQTCKPTTFDAPLRATDGWIRYDKTPDDRWTNSGSPNATDHLGVDFGAPRKINEVKFYTYDDGANIRVPASYTVQYLNNGSWVDVPNQTKSPAAPAANDANEVTFPTVTTSQFRVLFTPQAGKFVGVTELESWYPETPAVKIINKNSNLELGISGSAITAGGAAQQQTADSTANHQWKIVPAENGYYKIFNTNSGQVLGIQGASKTAGAIALQWGDSLTSDHLWSVVDAGGGYCKLVNKNSGMVLGVQNMSTASGATVLQWDDNGTADQLWRLAAADGSTPFNS
ncbi:RICIN domain-containing protein [Streptomyces sp. NPDC005474]|uniref:MGH1-like glycoside hydrolase domain-containing protein n=1 Tax=Streptomyces sp. NPDC005474 TaxID=3154878 RepID=UPI0034533C15